MSVITIQCRLVAKESSLRYLWELMAQKNTPLVNELLQAIVQHSDFESWLQKGSIPQATIKALCDSLKNDPRFSGQPGRFYTSAISLVSYNYKSWFALQKRRQQKIEGKERWLNLLKSDGELEEECDRTLEEIRAKASQILNQFQPQTENAETPPREATQKKKGKKSKSTPFKGKAASLFNTLFNAYAQTKDSLERCTLAYLLKNNGEVSLVEEDPEAYQQRRRKKEIEIERLKEQLKSRHPKGRDLTAEKWLETLEAARTQQPESEAEAATWQANLLRNSSPVPFPVNYETSEDLKWFKNEAGRICVWFNGLSEHHFEVRCDNRQLHWFERFFQDQQIKRQNNNQHSSSLFTLRSGRIGWQECSGEGEAWNVHHLKLYCSLDTRLWTAEGTEQVAQEKAAEVSKILTKTKQKDDLNKKQLAFIKRGETMLARINTPFPRPSKPLYQGQSAIVVGVSLGLEKPATVAVIDVPGDRLLTYRNIKQLLGDHYPLLNRRRQQQRSLSQKRQKAQKQGAANEFGESELGQYIDRLLAKEIVAIARIYQAGSIALPKLTDIREILHSEMQTRVEKKIPGYKEAQDKYAKQYRVNIHRWSYGRLMDAITSQSAKVGIVIEVGKQPSEGRPQDKARELAISAYCDRSVK